MPRHPLGEKAMTDAERQRKRRGRLRKERGPDDRLSDRQKLAEAQKEMWRLRQRISDLEAARALRERAALAAKTEAAKPTPPTEPDSEDPRIARLKKANSELRGKLRHMHKFCEDESSKRGIMTFTTYGKILKALHPDNRPSDAEREEAFKAFSQWKQDGARHVGEDRDRGGARDDAVGLAGLASCPVARPPTRPPRRGHPRTDIVADAPGGNFGRTSAPCLPQAVQTKSGSTSDSRT